MSSSTSPGSSAIPSATMANRWERRRARRPAVRRHVRGDDADFVELERGASRAGERQVTEMERIEGSPEDADTARFSNGQNTVRSAKCEVVGRRSASSRRQCQRARCYAAAPLPFGPERFQQSVESRPGGCGDPEEGEPQLARVLFERRDPRRRRSTASIFVAATICGFAASVRVEQPQLASQHVEVLTPDRGPIAPDTSTRCTSTFVRSRCFRNRSPRPCPSCAPSIRPGTSATTKLRLPLMRDDAEIRRQRRERVVGDLRAVPRRCARSAWTCRRSG